MSNGNDDDFENTTKEIEVLFGSKKPFCFQLQLELEMFR